MFLFLNYLVQIGLPQINLGVIDHHGLLVHLVLDDQVSVDGPTESSVGNTQDGQEVGQVRGGAGG